MIMILVLLMQTGDGYLTVHADQNGLPVYLDNDLIGTTPIERYPVKPGEYDVGFFPSDSVEQASWQLKDGNMGALWRVARFGEGMVKARIAADHLTTVELNYARTNRAPTRLRLKIGGCIGGTFVLGVLATLAVQALVGQ